MKEIKAKIESEKEGEVEYGKKTLKHYQ